MPTAVAATSRMPTAAKANFLRSMSAGSIQDSECFFRQLHVRLIELSINFDYTDEEGKELLFG
jgi:hypothetical protein